MKAKIAATDNKTLALEVNEHLPGIAQIGDPQREIVKAYIWDFIKDYQFNSYDFEENYSLFLGSVVHRSHNTALAYANDGRYFGQYLADNHLNLNQVDHVIVGQYVKQLKDSGFKASTIRRRVDVLKSFFRFLIVSGTLKENAAEDIKTPNPQRDTKNFLTIGEVFKLLETARSCAVQKGKPGARAFRDYTILEMMYGTGARVGEVIGLDIGDIEEKGYLVKIKGKGERTRIVPMGSMAWEALQSYLKRYRPRLARPHTQDELFISRSGVRLSIRDIDRIILRCAKSAGIQKHISGVTLRHTFASHMIAAGASLRGVQAALGHSSISTTRIYTHIERTALIRSHTLAHPRS